MRKVFVIALMAALLSGCATYRFKHGQAPQDKGYVVSRDNYTILEYTLGKEKAVPGDLGVAKERFHRRRGTVEYYYKKMGAIENRFKRAVYDPMVMGVKLVTGVFRLPFIAVSDYKYDHNPAYREKIRKIEEEKDLKEEARIASLRQKLDLYIQKELDSERLPEASKAELVDKELTHLEEMHGQVSTSEAELAAAPEAGVSAAAAPQTVSKRAAKPKAVKAKPEKKKPVITRGQPQAVIAASPKRGLSPLTVHFSGARSRSPSGRIVSYHWDFGDGDTSTLPRPRNTYYSGLSEPQAFSVTLTVKDAQGNTATSSLEIEVLNK